MPMPWFNNLFGGSEASTQQPAAPQPQQTTPEAPPAPAAPSPTPNPLDKLTHLYENKGQSNEPSLPNYSLAPQDLQQVASQLDFTSSMTPQELQAFKSLPPEVQAVQSAMARQAYTLALGHATHIMGQTAPSLATFSAHQANSQTQQLLAKQAAPDFLQAQLNNPVVQAEFNSRAAQLLRSDPTLTPAQAAAQTVEWMQSLAAAFTAPVQPTAQEKANAPVDFFALAGLTKK